MHADRIARRTPQPQRRFRNVAIDEEAARAARQLEAGDLDLAGREVSETRFVADVQSRLAWKLGPGQRVLALQQRTTGKNAEAVARWMDGLERARIELNDPRARH